MKNTWERVQLKELITPVSRPEPVDPRVTYRLLGAHWYAQGLYTKNTLSGSEIKARQVYQVKRGDFVYNRLFGWKGSFAIATDENDGCYVSNEFPCFTVKKDLADGHYLWKYFSLSSVWDEVLNLSTGGTPTSRNRLKEEQLLAMKVPLPPLDEQRRIVFLIDELLAAKIEEIGSLKHAIENDARRMLLSAFRSVTTAIAYRPMAQIAPITRRKIQVQPDGNYPELGIRSFGKGTFHKPRLSGVEVGSKRLYIIEPGDLVFNNVFAWEGAVAVARPNDSGRVGSHRFITCVPKAGITTSNFLCFYFLTEEGLKELGEASPGGAGRNRTLGLQALERIVVPVPTYEKQIWFGDLQGKVDALKSLQAETTTELHALMPSILSKAFSGEL